AHGRDLFLRVPVGTQILEDDKETVLADLTQPGQRVVLLRGGDGGFGNSHYKSSTNQAPRRAGPGWPGRELWVWLRLKLIADAGLGTRFLAHVERCAVILHLIDGTEDDVVGAYRTIRHELADYGHGLTDKPEIVGLNKIDAIDPDAVIDKCRALARAARPGTRC